MAKKKDQATSQPEPKAKEPVVHEYTVLHEILRHGETYPPGDIIEFAEDELHEAQELLEHRVIHPGTGEDAEAALEAADEARKAAEPQI